MIPWKRPLWRREATGEGDAIVFRARLLSFRYWHLSDGELIRLAYWGASGDKP